MARFRVRLYYSQLVHYPALGGIAIVYPKDNLGLCSTSLSFTPVPRLLPHTYHTKHHPCVHRTWFGTTLRQWYHLRDSADSQKG
jgi:hypothetical protein